jgi:hypothetical protein
MICPVCNAKDTVKWVRGVYLCHCGHELTRAQYDDLLAGDYDAWLTEVPDHVALIEMSETITAQNTNARQRIFQAVVNRGYLEGWTMEQFAARQVAKAGEELGELVTSVRGGRFMMPSACSWQYYLKAAAGWCRQAFDESDAWTWTQIDTQVAKSELEDLYVVLSCLEAALNEIDGPYDMEQAALDKALADVERGTR